MYAYSKACQQRKAQCHPDLQVLLDEIIKYFDCTITCSFRDQKEQDEAFAKGFSKLKWPHGNHNKLPSIAVDVSPSPIDYKDIERQCYFAGYVMAIAEMLYQQGRMKHRVRWGRDWNRNTDLKDERFLDYPHIELIIE